MATNWGGQISAQWSNSSYQREGCSKTQLAELKASSGWLVVVDVGACPSKGVDSMRAGWFARWGGGQRQMEQWERDTQELGRWIGDWFS